MGELLEIIRTIIICASIIFIISTIDFACILANFITNKTHGTNDKYIFATVQNLQEKTSWHIAPCIIVFVLIGIVTPINFIGKLIYMLAKKIKDSK